jgi:hypothetical protein
MEKNLLINDIVTRHVIVLLLPQEPPFYPYKIKSYGIDSHSIGLLAKASCVNASA